MRAWRVVFTFLPEQWLEVTPGNVVREHRARVVALGWEHAILEAAADAPGPLAPHVLDAIRREDVTVTQD